MVHQNVHRGAGWCVSVFGPGQGLLYLVSAECPCGKPLGVARQIFFQPFGTLSGRADILALFKVQQEPVLKAKGTSGQTAIIRFFDPIKKGLLLFVGPQLPDRKSVV